VVRQRSSLPAALDRLGRHHLERLHAGITDIVEQHGNIFAELRRESEAEPDVRLRVLHSRFDPWNASNHVGPEFHGFPHQAIGAGLAHDAVLREGDNLKIDDATKLFSYGQQRLDAFESRLAVDVGEESGMW
jgi:hypothetical protein